MTKYPSLSVIIPVRNEERFVAECAESIVRQDYPREDIEVLFVDGCSDDRTVEILNQLSATYGYIRVLDNPGRTAPCAMNVGIRNAKNDVVIRLDAHAEYPNTYFRMCVETLMTEDCENAGGLAITRGRGYVGGIIAEVLSTKLGVGNSAFRTGARSGYVDTVPFGCFRRTLFDRIGLYDERLTRNQDNELSYRIRKNGGKIFLNSDIKFVYYCRDTIIGLMKMGYLNGLWSVFTMKLVPGTMGVRHFVPFLFVISLFVAPILVLALPFKGLVSFLFVAELVAYSFVASVVSLKIAIKKKDVGAYFVAMLIFPSFHIAYGAGSLVGLFRLSAFLRTHCKSQNCVV